MPLRGGARQGGGRVGTRAPQTRHWARGFDHPRLSLLVKEATPGALLLTTPRRQPRRRAVAPGALAVDGELLDLRRRPGPNSIRAACLRRPSASDAGRAGRATILTTIAPMRVRVSGEAVEILLSRWEKILGLMRDIRVPRGDVSDVRVIDDPLREAMRGGLKVGLRVPWLYYVARSLRLDRAWVVRRGAPGLSFAVHNHPSLQHIIVSTPEAEALARALRVP